MNGRFAPPLVAFALATAFVVARDPLPEFFVQLHDPNVLAGPLFAVLVSSVGYPFVLALCGALAGVCVLLTSLRTRRRGASPWFAALGGLLVALALTSRAGVSLDPIGWCCLALFALVIDGDNVLAWYALVPLALVWSLLEGGATAGAVLVLVATIGAAFEPRDDGMPMGARLYACAGVLLVAFVQLHLPLWRGYGAHWLYLDALLPGVHRDRFHMLPFTAPAIAAWGIVVLAVWYGVRRRGRAADTVTFVAAFFLLWVDERNLPFFAIVAAPVVADAVASYYLDERRGLALSFGTVAVSWLVGAACFVAAITLAEPRATGWPRQASFPAPFVASLTRGDRHHRVLCTDARWCDDPAIVATIPHVADDRAGLIPRSDLLLQAAVANARGSWLSRLDASDVDRVIAPNPGSVASLLRAAGWNEAANAGGRALLLRGGR